jgi:hypothetical protein
MIVALTCDDHPDHEWPDALLAVAAIATSMLKV